MDTSTSQWESIYGQVPLSQVPQHFAGIRASPFTLDYLSTVLRHCPPGGTSCESGTGSGYSAIWLSLRGIRAQGFDLSPILVERSRHINALLGGKAQFHVGDLFRLYEEQTRQAKPRIDVVHHQGVLEHFAAPWIRAALAQQVACARYVVFSVPSVFYPFEPEFGDERLLPLEEWRALLEPFDVEELRYYGDPRHSEREHVLVVLRGQEVTPQLLAMMEVGAQPYPPGISAIVHTRNEAARLGECLESLRGWTDEVIVCDMESEDETVAIARAHGAQVLPHPRIANFDRARNVSALRARFRWIFYLDADERVPPALGEALRHLTLQQDALEEEALEQGAVEKDALEDEAAEQGTSETQPPKATPFAGLLVPFRHHFVGHWMRCLYPGYTAPRLLRNGRFTFNARLHSGAKVEGPVVCFPADDPNLAIVHFSYDSLSHYLTKLNGYTDGEAANLFRDGVPFHWQNAIRSFVSDFQLYYQGAGAAQDGVHGFLYSFLSGFYRFEQHAKLFEHRFRAGQLGEGETAVPGDIVEMLEFALRVAREKPLPAPAAIPLAAPVEKAPAQKAPVGKAPQLSTLQSVVWSGPLLDPSGYGEGSRNFLFGLDEGAKDTSFSLTAQVLPWSHDEVDMPPGERQRLDELTRHPAAPGFTHIIHNLAPGLKRHPQAGITIGRTMFETDRLPLDWAEACNRLDAIWVPSEFHRGTFIGAGVAPEKLAVVPEALDAPAYDVASSPQALEAGLSELPDSEAAFLRGLLVERQSGKFFFLSVFDWTRHKGWDALLRGFLAAFEGRPDVVLLLRTWSTMGYGAGGIEEQAARFAREELGRDLPGDPRLRFLPQRLSRAGLVALYAVTDAFVLPSRGEGWGRPYMEAMACGKPVIGTGWSGNTAFMTKENSYLLDFAVRDVSAVGWTELPSYRGHRWAEPDAEHLVELLRHVAAQREEGRARGRVARQEVLSRYNRRAVAQVVLKELARIGVGGAVGNAAISASRFGLGASPETSPEKPNPPAEVATLTVQWEGAFFNWHSLAQVNREMALALIEEPSDEKASPEVELSLLPTESPQFDPQGDPHLRPLARRAFAPLSSPAQVLVRHFFPPRFDPPASGRLVLMQPWEYGFLPVEWIEPLRQQVDQVWCYSQYVRRVYLDSGIPDDKLRVVPLGIDPQIFHPAVPPYVFTQEPGAQALWDRGPLWRDKTTGATFESKPDPFVFLFVGGTIHRKGIDILLEAYRRAFTCLDEVCLVIKDTGTSTVYRDAHSRDSILERINDLHHPPLIYVDEDLAPSQLAGLFTASDCLVQPYRGEGFCLPVLEAMACGIPSVVPEGGPTDDFVDESVGWRLPAAHRPFQVGDEGRGQVGPWECVGPTWAFEVDPDDLARLLRRIAGDRAEVRKRGAAASLRARSQWTWRHSAEHARAALRELVETAPNTAPSPTPINESKREEGPPHSTADQMSPRPTPTISLCLIVKNEERVLGACLESASPWFDEVIVVDTGSTDATVEIAERHGAKVFHFPWCDDFSAARNASLDHATGDWIFWMDADDTLPPESGRQIHDLAALAEERTAGFIVPVHIPAAPGESGFTVVDHVKLFRNRPAHRFQGRIHEQILEALHRAGGVVERSGAHVVHSGYDYSPDGQVHKRERDLRILDKDLLDRPDHPFVLFNIGMTAYHIKDFERAVPALLRCLEKSGPRESTLRKVYAMLAGCFLEQSQVAQAKAWVEKGLKRFPHDPELLFRAGIIWRESGELEKAAQAYHTLLGERETGHIDSLDVTMTGFKAHHNLALIYLDLKRPDQAERHFREAVADQSDFVPSWGGLREALLVQGKAAEARDVEEVLVRLASRGM